MYAVNRLELHFVISALALFQKHVVMSSGHLRVHKAR